MPESPEPAHWTPADRAETDAVLTAAGPPAGRWVLVVGSGTGVHARLFRSAGASRVVGVDADRSLIAQAQRQEERDPLGISYEVHEPLKLPVIGDFDVVVAFGVTGPLDALLARLAANLTSGGLLVLSYFGAADPAMEAFADAGLHSVGQQPVVAPVPGDPRFVVLTARHP
ncbi:class I SAM-dependent methyltransferase [Amycolatopsis sp. NPDC050768]|uniref:class I SAM-dependent methyltransferase n=1 Tax=Amycolatopsis sp. NPDC050768 TaxID=3154839 RepID=UPI003410496C